MRDVYEMLTYLLVIILSSIIMVYALKRKARKKQNKGGQ
ncbi:hypothetical protein IJ21_36290 [Paenibacillus sp. 32O-W]|jgi:hypothetical protein|nr:hypothetical protein IJ21_36290 [Paenibacillus sp. 32O-W]